MPYKEDGTWRGAVMVNGQRKTKLFDTKAEAKKWEQEEKKRLKSGEVTPQGMELITFCNFYLDHAEQRFVKKTYLEKRALAQRICDKWGKHTQVEEINVNMVATYLEQEARKRSNYSANVDRKNLHAMWAWGVKRHDLRQNPVSKVDKFPHDRKPQYTPPEKDVLKVKATANPEEKIFLDACLHTAARRSEIFRWTWTDDINFERKLVRLGTRKNKDGSMEYTWLPMNDDLYKSLMWLWKNRKFPESPYVFVCTHPSQYYGQPYSTRKRFMKSLCDRAGVKPFGFHALRRYVASILVDKHKASAKSAQRILRHKYLSTTEGSYLDGSHTDLRETMNLLCEKEDENILHVDLHGEQKRA